MVNKPGEKSVRKQTLDLIDERKVCSSSDSESDMEESAIVENLTKSKIVEVLMMNIEVLRERAISAEKKKEMIEVNEKLVDELKRAEENEFGSQSTGKFEEKLSEIASDVKQLMKRVNQRQQPARSVINLQSSEPYDRSQNIVVIDQGTRTYAEVLKTVHEKGNLIRDKIRCKMTITKKNKILAICRSKEERDKLMNNINSYGGEVKGKEAQGKFVKFIITRLPKTKFDGEQYTDEELEEEMLSRRSDTNLLKNSYKRLKAFDAKNGKRVFIISVDAKAARSIEEDPYFFVGLESMKAQPKIDLIQCFRCQKYGHITKNCTLTIQESICSKCAKSGHLSKDCTSQNKQCICCVRERLDGSDHYAMSDLCPIKRRERQRAFDSLRN